jgi:shikimate kinase
MAASAHRVFLIGFMGVGKTTLGRRLAKRLGLEYRDLDKEIEFAAKMFIPDIFSLMGEERFRQLEADILRQQPDNCLIACGGGTPCFHGNMDWMNANGQTIYLQASPGFLSDRLLKSKKPRPLIMGKDEAELKAFIQEKLDSRKAFYEQAKIIAPLPQTRLKHLVEMIDFN